MRDTPQGCGDGMKGFGCNYNDHVAGRDQDRRRLGQRCGADVLRRNECEVRGEFLCAPRH